MRDPSRPAGDPRRVAAASAPWAAASHQSSAGRPRRSRKRQRTRVRRTCIPEVRSGLMAGSPGLRPVGPRIGGHDSIPNSRAVAASQERIAMTAAARARKSSCGCKRGPGPSHGVLPPAERRVVPPQRALHGTATCVGPPRGTFRAPKERRGLPHGTLPGRELCVGQDPSSSFAAADLRCVPAPHISRFENPRCDGTWRISQSFPPWWEVERPAARRLPAMHLRVVDPGGAQSQAGERGRRGASGAAVRRALNSCWHR